MLFFIRAITAWNKSVYFKVWLDYYSRRQYKGLAIHPEATTGENKEILKWFVSVRNRTIAFWGGDKEKVGFAQQASKLKVTRCHIRRNSAYAMMGLSLWRQKFNQKNESLNNQVCIPAYTREIPWWEVMSGGSRLEHLTCSAWAGILRSIKWCKSKATLLILVSLGRLTHECLQTFPC